MFDIDRTPNKDDTSVVSSEKEVEQLLLLALDALSLPARVLSRETHAADLVLDLAGASLRVDVKRYALVDEPRSLQVVANWRRPRSSRRDRVLVVVADRIVAGARERLRSAGIGWLDLRGHLFLRAPGVVIDSDVPPSASLPKADGRLLAGPASLSVAVELLLRAEGSLPVRRTAGHLGVAASTVSATVQGLREEGLIDAAGRVDRRALFWLTAERWKPRWVGVGSAPSPDGALANPALHLGLHDLAERGWALTGNRAAAVLSAPIAIGQAAPPDLYVPTEQARRLALAILGEASEPSQARARIAVPPVVTACELRLPAARWADEHWPSARHVFVALDLAQDPGRGREILDGWVDVPADARVW
jgi:hypothetical protein